MKQFLSDFLSATRLGKAVEHERLTIVPLFGQSGDTLYLTLSEAFGENRLKVTEIDEDGSVPVLEVHNHADLPVLILDGEELTGAKQNRVLNTSVFLRQQSKTRIPVSCTEQDRWSYTAPEFSDSEVVMSPRMRSVKNQSVAMSLAETKEFTADQGAVWDGVEDLQERTGRRSSTSAMRDVHKSFADQLQTYRDAMQLTDGQTGMVALIDGVVVGMDNLSRADAFAGVGPRLISSYAIEALTSPKPDRTAGGPRDAAAFLDSLALLEAQVYPSVSLGHDYRFNANHVVGSALVYRDQFIHTAFFPIANESDDQGMSGPRTRRNFRR